MKLSLVRVLILGMCVVLPAAGAEAKNGKGNGKGQKHESRIEQRYDGRADAVRLPSGRTVVIAPNGGNQVRQRSGRPPGWSKGRKTGWGNCNLPPGQAKKHGCRQYGRRVRRSDGTVVVVPGTTTTRAPRTSGKQPGTVIQMPSGRTIPLPQ